jgi:hypothetical protein
VVDSVAGSVVGTDVRSLRRDEAASQEPEPFKEDTMHPEIANQLAQFRHVDLVAEAAHRRLAREARQAGGRSDRHRTTRRWWWVLQPSRALASE